MNTLLKWVFIFISNAVVAQNLVSNPSFENSKFEHFCTNQNTRKILALILLIFPFLLFSQNHLSNASFEEGNGIYESLCTKNVQAKNWDNTNSYSSLPPLICNCRYESNENEKNLSNCHKFKAPDGCRMLEMIYCESCIDFKRKTFCRASYITTKLIKPLETGKVYKLTLLIYAPKIANTDANAMKYFGIKLGNKKTIQINDAMIEHPSVLVPSDSFDLWQTKTIVFRPLCEVNYLTLGIFRTNVWPNVNSNLPAPLSMLNYFIDKLDLHEIVEPEFKKDSIFNITCIDKSSQSGPNENESNFSLYFTPNKADLLPEYQKKVDSLALEISKKSTIVVVGHTDSKGMENKLLSEQRANNVANYLMSKTGLNNHHFLIEGLADSAPEKSNNTSLGRSKNRRVEVLVNHLSLSELLYRKAMQASNNSDSTFLFINKWLNVSRQSTKILLLFDSRLKKRLKPNQYSLIYQKIKQSYKTFKKPYFAFQLDSLFIEDQKHRSNPMRALMGQLDFDTLSSNRFFENITMSEWKQIDSLNYLALQKLISMYGMPKISEVGITAANASYYITQHQTQLNPFEFFIEKYKALCIEGEGQWINYATMFDRIQRMKNKPQRYGTQMELKPGTSNIFYVAPFESAEIINKSRTELGLGPMPYPLDFEVKTINTFNK